MAKVYDDEKTSNSDLAKITGINPAEEKRMESAAAKGAKADLAARESKAKSSNSGGGDSDEPGRMRKAWQKIKQRKKQAIFGGIMGLGLLGGGYGLFTITSGPFQVIHGAQMLAGFHMGPAEDFGDDRSAKFIIYALAGKEAKGRLGVIRNFRADAWERKLNAQGLEPVYSTNTQRLIGYNIIDEGKAARHIAEMETAGYSVSGPATGVDHNGNPLPTTATSGINVETGDIKGARVLAKVTVGSIARNGLTGWMGSRLLIKRGGVDFHPMKNQIRSKRDTRAEFKQKEREARAKAIESGVNGNSGGIDRDARSRIMDKIQPFINAAKGPLIAIAAICGAKSFSGSIDAQNLQNQFVLMRMGMERITAGSQTQSNMDVNWDILGVYADDFYDEETKTSWTQDPGIQYESGEEITGKDLVEGVKPSKDNQKPFIFDVIDRIPTNLREILPLGTGILIPPGVPTDICEIAEDISNAISDIWGIGWILDRAQDALNLLVKTITGQTLDYWVQKLIQFFSTEGPNLLAQGAERGGLDNVGARLAANNQFQALGGRELSAQEGSEVKLAYQEEQKRQFAHASIYDRYFNLYESRSAAASVAMAMPKSRTQFIASIQKIPSSFANTAASLLGMNKAYAGVARTYDYGFPLYGYSLAERDNPDLADPYANENYMLEGDRLDRMNQEYGNECFFMTVTSNGDLQYGESGDFHGIPEKCKDQNNIELTRYRFYLADLVTGHTLNCYEGDEASCNQLGFGSGGNTGGGGGETPGEFNVGEAFQPSDHMTCPVGTDGGVQDGYNEGTLVKIRVCIVQGIKVNVRIASNVDALLNASRAAGVTMSGGGFRTMADQQNTYNRNCGGGSCSPPTAKPGYSNHQMGLAIDFTQGGTILNSRSPGFNWLKANADKYGLQNFPPEPWHWSVDGT